MYNKCWWYVHAMNRRYISTCIHTSWLEKKCVYRRWYRTKQIKCPRIWIISTERTLLLDFMMFTHKWDEMWRRKTHKILLFNFIWPTHNDILYAALFFFFGWTDHHFVGPKCMIVWILINKSLWSERRLA